MNSWPVSENPARCADLGHPGVTYNPGEDKTWCLCGQVTYPGKPAMVDQHLACCGGPLDRFKEKP
ncbi:MAG TPA: hypothetical protein VHA37_06680 [Candidatus Saccharimonadales bacterium]|nr:hypothetical protein [Candidatus Saccharimonadales bacterium]